MDEDLVKIRQSMRLHQSPNGRNDSLRDDSQTSPNQKSPPSNLKAKSGRRKSMTIA